MASPVSGVVRVLCLGDSLTEGLTVEGMEEVLHPYSDRLRQLLAERIRTPNGANGPANDGLAAGVVDLVNAGVVRSARCRHATS